MTDGWQMDEPGWWTYWLNGRQRAAAQKIDGLWWAWRCPQDDDYSPLAKTRTRAEAYEALQPYLRRINREKP